MESFNVNANPKKRQRKDDDVSDKEETKKTALRDILTSIILLDEQENQEQEQERWVMEAQQDKSLFEANHEQKIQATSEPIFYNGKKNRSWAH
ncbi:hypothetical protein FH972_003052 [Carpinus fangiana]|uniref:Uncharacterized protein n=1 Tax=Carpinus fangiana TaxID=176857 RepID=A0A5N6QJX5_9ROSI|nr:hypothetical protein FH972_003052 [Carpinus fangiana]